MSVLTAPDHELLEAWRGGQREAGEQLFERYFDRVARFFVNKVRADVDDLVQETFVHCVRSRDNVRDGDAFRSFLFGVAYNVLRMHFRGTRMHDARFDPAIESAHDLAPGPSTWLRGRAEETLLLEGLRRLPLELQTVLELFYWEDMTSAAIAEVVALPHGTVRSRLRRGRELLRAELEQLSTSSELLDSTLGNLDGWAAGLRPRLPSDAKD
jgi:RNA polymerase sigma factor (sigma-70 family)